MARNETGKMLRVRPQTAERLRLLVERLERGEEARGMDTIASDPGRGITSDDVIGWLIDQRDQYESRRRKAKQTARDRRRAAANADGSPYRHIWDDEDIVVPVGMVQCEDGVWR